MKKKDWYLLPPERVNILLHATGVLFGLIGIPYLIITAANHLDTPGIIATIMYGLGFMMLFTFSTLFHAVKKPRTKKLLLIFDHISIYFLIAGTYTPFIILFVQNNFGRNLLVALWVLTLIGSFVKIFYTGKFDNLSTIIYILMGLLLLIGGNRFFTTMPNSITTLIITGAGLYCAGVIFYIWEKYRYSHGVWHLFVLAAAICHYVAVLQSVNQ